MRWLWASLAVLCAHAQQQPGEATLGKIRAAVAENLKRLPDYTCAETIERSYRHSKSKRFVPIDTIHLEVAYVEGKELFGWADAGRIGESDIDQLVGGAIGNGAFALVLKGVFLSTAPAFQYMGDTDLAGKPALRYEYRVEESRSGYRVRTGSGEAMVGYHGSFWVDASTLDLLRIELAANYIPPNLKLASVTEWMDYARTAIGNSEFLIAQSSELSMVRSDGSADRNRTSFHACRQFSGESVIKFDAGPTELPPVPAPVASAEAILPSEFAVELRLETPIDSDSAAVGDPIRAVLSGDIKSGRATVIPKGATITGHISFLQKRGPYHLMRLQFNSIAFDGGHAELAGRDNSVSVTSMINGRIYSSQSAFNSRPLVFRADRLRLPRTSRITLHSRLLKSKEHDSVRP